MSKNHKGNPYREIYVEHYGPIPKGYHVHHIDHNPLNNDPKNLVAVSPEEHAKLHGDDWTKWASKGGKKGGTKCRDEGIGWFAEGNTRFAGKEHKEESKAKTGKTLKEKYASGELVHWTKKYSKEEVSRRISAGDPGKSTRGKTAWNKGKTFKRRSSR